MNKKLTRIFAAFSCWFRMRPGVAGDRDGERARAHAIARTSSACRN
jgi:hypothetical protein